jgi:YhcH/YjgK/YiaL family protein
MIVDLLENLPLYADLHPAMPKVIAYLKEADLLSLPVGKNIVDPETFVLRDSYLTKPLSECFFEGHRIYADVQIVLKGEEFFGYCPKTFCELGVTVPYHPEKEVEKYEPKETSRIHLVPGMFAIVLPEDLHLAKRMVDQPCQVEKAILKFKL